MDDNDDSIDKFRYISKKSILFIIVIISLIAISYFAIASFTTPSSINTNSGKGVWLRGEQMSSINLANAEQQGISNIYLSYAAVDKYGYDKVEKFITKAHNNNIQVYIWVQCFQDSEGWHSPTDNKQISSRLDKINEYAQLNGVDGIMLDYIRYNGHNPQKVNHEAITNFVKQSREITNKSDIKLALCVMPEKSKDKKSYGQDIPELSKYADSICPMIYKGNYKQNAAWITSTTKWFKENTDCKISPILQTYKSDKNLTKLSSKELKADIKASYDGGADGVSLFRYGYVDELQ